MIYKAIKFGAHDDVAYAEFGTGDIRFTKCKESEHEFGSILIFQNNDEPRQIGEIDNEGIGELTDTMKRPDIVFKFRKKESIQAVISSLQELFEQFPDDLDVLPSEVKPIEP
jgi:hypothetical protein